MRYSSLSLLPFAVIAVVTTTGCAGKVRSNAGLSLHGHGGGVAAPSIAMNGHAHASGSAHGNGWGSAQGYGGAHGYGGVNGYGNAHGYGNTAGQAGAQGGCNGPPSAPAPVPFTPAPVFFGVPLSGAQDVVFVLDRSGSMSSSLGSSWSAPSSPLAAIAAFGLQAAATVKTTGTLHPHSGFSFDALRAGPPQPAKIDAARSELLGALGGLPDGTRFNIVFFNEGVASLAPQMVTMNAVTRLGAITFVNGIAAGGSTAAVPALRAAYSSRPYRVVFLSDGLANTGGTGQDLLSDARGEMRRGVRFDTVGIGSDQDAALMQALAAESGGVAVRR